MNTALLLIALGFGYKIFADASAKGLSKSLRILGRFTGIFIMLVSLMGSLCTTFSAIQFGKCSSAWKTGGPGQSKTFCPFTSDSMHAKHQPDGSVIDQMLSQK